MLPAAEASSSRREAAALADPNRDTDRRVAEVLER
jgi:hypothetical protein